MAGAGELRQPRPLFKGRLEPPQIVSRSWSSGASNVKVTKGEIALVPAAPPRQLTRGEQRQGERLQLVSSMETHDIVKRTTLMCF